MSPTDIIKKKRAEWEIRMANCIKQECPNLAEVLGQWIYAAKKILAEIKPCVWKQDENTFLLDDDERTWNTGCGGMFTIMNGTPAENKMKYCCYCGAKIARAGK